MTKDRSEFIDILKGIAAILVVAGHAIENGLGGEHTAPEIFYNNPFHIFIYSFHMPLFMMISGYLFSFSVRNHSFGNNLTNKVKTILIPNATWCITIIIINCLKEYIHFGYVSALEDGFLLYNGCYYFLHLYWFLWALLASSVIVLLVNRFLKDNLFIYILLLILMLFLPGKFQEHIFMYPYFVIAYMAGKYDALSRVKALKKNTMTVIVCFVVIGFFFLIPLYEYNSYIYNTGVSLINTENQGYTVIQKLGLDLYRWGIGLLGSMTVVLALCFLYSLVKNKALFQPLIACGRYSLTIYCSNPIAVAVVVPIVLKVIRPDNIGGMLLIVVSEVLLETAISCMIAFFINKNKYLRLCYTGRAK